MIFVPSFRVLNFTVSQIWSGQCTPLYSWTLNRKYFSPVNTYCEDIYVHDQIVLLDVSSDQIFLLDGSRDSIASPDFSRWLKSLGNIDSYAWYQIPNVLRWIWALGDFDLKFSFKMNVKNMSNPLIGLGHNTEGFSH